MKYIFLFLSLLMAATMVAADALSPVFPKRDPFSASVSITDNEIHSRWIPLYFANAGAISHLIGKESLHLLSDQGQLVADDNSNQLWLEDDDAHLKKIVALITHLDQPGPQFMISAKIINVDRDYRQALGFLFETQKKSTPPPNGLSIDQSNLTDTAGQFSLSIAKLGDHDLLDMQISALEEEGHAKVISSPSLTTLNNQPAIIESGAEVPYQETSLSGGTSTNFKKAVLRLKVTPKVMPDHHILLHIALNQDKVSSLRIKDVPAIETQQITTEVIVKDNQTIALGGILETENTQTKEGIPVLSTLPWVGELFQYQASLKKHQELLIFITPSMMKSL